MNSIDLHFFGSSSPQLGEVRFRRACGDLYHSVRGKTCGASGTNRTFQWSPAVRALCSLLVSAKSGVCLPNENKTGLLSGNKGSPASSLDYALSKQPMWMSDMFGSTAQGDCYLRRIILRTNPERKYPGPVRLALNYSVISAEKIRIFVDDREATIEELHVLVALLSAVNLGVVASCDGRVLGTECAEEQVAVERDSASSAAEQYEAATVTSRLHDPRWISGLAGLYRIELSHMLSATDVFTKAGRARTLSSLYQIEPLRRILGDPRSLIGALDGVLSGPSTLGLGPEILHVKRFLDQRGPLSVHLASVHVGAIAIARSLSKSRGLPLQVMDNYAHSTQLAQHVVGCNGSGAPDLFCVNVATAAWFMTQKESVQYRPFTLMPMFTQRVLGRNQTSGRERNRAAVKGGCYHLMRDVPTAASLYYDELVTEGVIKEGISEIKETELSEIPSLLETGDPSARVIVPFPFYRLYQVDDIEFLDSEAMANTIGVRSTVLFIREELQREPKLLQLLSLAIRDAWLELIEQGELFEGTLTDMLKDHRYLRTITRLAGLSFLSGRKFSDSEARVPSWITSDRGESVGLTAT